jgi:hypothetical protein
LQIHILQRQCRCNGNGIAVAIATAGPLQLQRTENYLNIYIFKIYF